MGGPPLPPIPRDPPRMINHASMLNNSKRHLKAGARIQPPYGRKAETHNVQAGEHKVKPEWSAQEKRMPSSAGEPPSMGLSPTWRHVGGKANTRCAGANRAGQTLTCRAASVAQQQPEQPSWSEAPPESDEEHRSLHTRTLLLRADSRGLQQTNYGRPRTRLFCGRQHGEHLLLHGESRRQLLLQALYAGAERAEKDTLVTA